MNVWDAERIITVEQARQLIREQFPFMEAQSLELLGVGWDNTAYLVDSHYVFRFPRRQIAVPLLENETSALMQLAPLLPLTIPIPGFVGEPTDDFPWPFLGYNLIPGETACQANLSVQERFDCVEALAGFLKTLHGVPVAYARGWGLPEDPLQKCDPHKRVPQLLERIDKIGDYYSLRTLASQAAQLEAPPATTLVHGDLYFRHVLLNNDRKPEAIIDWGDIHIGTPSTDLAIAHSFLPSSAHSKFRELYGPITDEQWLLAKMRAAFYSTILLLYGRDTNDEALIREATTSLKFMTTEPASLSN